MKKIFVALFCLQTLFTFAQLTMQTSSGAPINNGDIFTYTTTTYPGCDFKYKIFNNSDDEIRVKAKLVSMVNANGTNVQLCVDPVCVYTLTVGNSYPNAGKVIEPQSSNGNFDHFENTNAGIDPNVPVEYTLKFYMVDDANAEVGNSVTFTYRYMSNLGVESNTLENTGIQLQSNIIGSQLNIRSTKNVAMTLFDINGRLVNTTNLTSGDHAINVSNLNAGVYIANFVNDEGKQATAKIIKK